MTTPSEKGKDGDPVHDGNVEAAVESIKKCILLCYDDKEFVREFDRLTGCNLSRKGSPIHLAIDDAAGRTEADLVKFSEFVMDAFWKRLEKASLPTGDKPQGGSNDQR